MVDEVTLYSAVTYIDPNGATYGQSVEVIWL